MGKGERETGRGRKRGQEGKEGIRKKERGGTGKGKEGKGDRDGRESLGGQGKGKESGRHKNFNENFQNKIQRNCY